MKKSIIYIFLFFVISSAWTVLAYLESKHFILVFDKYIKGKIEAQIGINFEFDRINITPFPPAISLINPRITKIKKDNLFKLPANSIMKTKEIGINFRMLQLFGNNLVINRVYLKDASIKTQLKPRSKKVALDDLDFLRKTIKVYFKDRLFTVEIKQVEIHNSSIDLKWKNGDKLDNLVIEKVHNLVLTKEKEENYSVLGKLNDLKINLNGSKYKLDFVQTNMNVSLKHLDIIAMELRNEELVLSARAKLKGDITKPKKMNGKVLLTSRSSFNSLSKIMPFFKNIKDLEGQCLSELELEGEFKSYKLKGKLKIDDFNYSLWRFEQVSLDVKYSSKNLLIENLFIKEESEEIYVSPIEIKMDMEAEQNKEFKVSFKNVDFNKFSGDLRKSINQIKMRLDGTLGLRTKFLIKDKKISLKEINFSPKFKVRNFVLDNQKYDTIKPLKKILQLSDLFVEAELKWERDKISFQKGSIESGAGNLKLSGDIKNKNFNIKAVSENLDLKEFFSKIINIPIQGEGPFVLKLLGQSSGLKFHFDLDHKDASYATMNFGHLKGSFTYDTGAQVFSIKNAKGFRATGNYLVNGEITQKSGLNIKADFIKMPLQEIFKIFAEQLSAIKWIPYDAKAIISAKAKITGKLSNLERNMDIQAVFNAKDINYKKERFSTARAEIGLSKGVYFFKNLNLKKYDSNILGFLYYNSQNKALNYELNSLNMQLWEIDRLSRLRSLIDAPVLIKMKGKGLIKDLKTITNITINESSVGEVFVPSLNFNMTTSRNINTIYGRIGKKSTELFLDISKNSLQKSKLQMRSEGSDFSFLLCLINKSLCEDKINLSLNISALSSWEGSNWKEMDGNILLKQGSLNLPDLQISISKPIDLAFDKGHLKSPPIYFRGNNSKFSANFSGSSLKENFFMKLYGSINLGVSKIFLSLLEKVTGTVNLETALLIDKKNDLRVNGYLELVKDSFIFAKGLNVPIKDFGGRIELKDNKINIQSLKGSLGRGPIVVSGRGELFLDKVPESNIKIELSNNRVQFFPVDYAIINKGELFFKGDSLPYSFYGDLDIKESLITKNITQKRAYDAGIVSSYLPLIFSNDKPIYSLNISLISKDSSYVRNDLVNGEFKGELLVRNNFKEPKIFGNGRLLKGRLFFKQTPFDINYFTFKFSGKNKTDPVISLRADAEVKNYKVNLSIHGNALNYNMNFSSVPPLSQKSILYLLTLGIENDRENLTTQENIESFAYAEASSFILDKFNLSNDLSRKGFSFNISSSSRKSEADIIRSGTDPSITSPKIRIRTNVLDNVDAFMGTTVGTASGRELDLNLEYRMTNKLSLKAVYKQEPGLNAGETHSSYGADMKIQWVFE